MEDLRERLDKFSRRLMDSVEEYNLDTASPSWIQVATLVLMAVPAFMFRRYFIAFLLMLLVVKVSLAANRFELNSFGVELATFSSITMATVFEPWTAASLGFVYVCLQIFSGSKPGTYLIWVIPTYAGVSYFIATLDVVNVVQVGIYTTATCQVFFAAMTFLVSRGQLPKYIQYAVFNLMFNFLMFQSFAEPLLALF